ncbi:MAG: response regulator [Terracidiphilus sp.]|jgi:CheY-like chemotaxis protein
MLDFGAQQDLPTVLLIDDDLISREVTATVLTMSGYTVYTAAGGAEALELLAAGACVPGVILMDAQMPGLRGTRLIEQLRVRSPAGLYVVSGSNPPPDVVAAADGFLLKPFTPDDLRKLLEERPAQAAPTPARKKQPKLPADAPIPMTPPAPASPSAAPVVNPEILAQLREMMPESAVRQIYAAIVADLARRIAALETAIANRDVAEIRRIGHAIKGGCSMAGALQAARLGAALESAPVNQMDNNSALLRDLRAAARNLESMLEAEFKA